MATIEESTGFVDVMSETVLLCYPVKNIADCVYVVVIRVYVCVSVCVCVADLFHLGLVAVIHGISV